MTAISFKRLKTGETVIRYKGQAYKAPAGIDVLRDKGEWFVDIVRDYVEDRCRSVKGTLHGFKVRGEFYKTGIYRADKKLLAIVFAAEGHIGWAEFTLRPDHLEEAQAALLPKFQRHGIYTALIKSLETRYAPVVLSSQALSVTNALRWMRYGKFDEARKRFRSNPGPVSPSKIQIRRAVIALLTRANT